MYAIVVERPYFFGLIVRKHIFVSDNKSYDEVKKNMETLKLHFSGKWSFQIGAVRGQDIYLL